ncbi:hypothetical protein AX17_002491 [Amanita inopinata Kibby_2008]|nr:hypothetical protein AX17_002491 [Amanita inopinata Kibby_2008]
MNLNLLRFLLRLLRRFAGLFSFIRSLLRRPARHTTESKSRCYSDYPNNLPLLPYDHQLPALATTDATSTPPTDTPGTLIVPSSASPEPMPTKSDLPNLAISDHVPGLVAVHATEYQRYDRGITHPVYYNDVSEFCIEPLTLTFESPQDVDHRWQRRFHPEGAPYFYDTKRHVLTDAYICNQSIRDIVDDYVDRIERFIEQNQLTQLLPESRTLVLEIRRTGRCGYYFVDHDNQCLFWLEPYDAIDMIDHLKVKMTAPLFEWEMKSQYWFHNELFPDDIPMSRATLKTFKNWLLIYAADLISSEQSSSNYSLEELEKILALLGDLDADAINGDQRDDGVRMSGAAWLVYRAMSRICHNRFLNLYGQHGARINRDQSIHEPRAKGLLIKIISPMLFYGPGQHFSKLSEISVDSIVRRTDWTKFSEDVINEWKNHTLLATVLLNANVAFLAIQSVDSQTSVFGHRSSAQRASYVSIIASIGAVVLGLVLVRLHDKRLNMNFLANRSASVIGLELVAILYGLPYALAMWSTFSFFTAFSIMCFSSGDVVTDVLISVSCLLVMLLLAWTISTSFEKTPYWRFSLLVWWDEVKAYVALLSKRARSKDQLSIGCSPLCC